MKLDTTPTAFDLSDVSVMIAMPVNRDLPWQTAKALMDTVTVLTQRNIKFEVQLLVGSSIVQAARSLIAHTFLKGSMNRLLMIDSDQSWQASDVIRMLALSTKMDVVVAPYPAKRDPPTFLLQPEADAVSMNEWGCIPIKGHGLGFTIASRAVIETLSDCAPLAELPSHTEPIPLMFRCDVVDGVFRGEDMAFFDDVRDMGLKVFLDPSLEIGHVGAKDYRGKIMDAIQQV